MDTNGMFSIFDIFVVGVGLYLLYTWYLLKFKGEVKESVLLSKGFPYKRCKDKEGYKAFIGPKLLVLGMIALLAGCVGLINDYQDFLGAYYIIVAVVFFAVVIWFSLMVRKAYKLFW